MSSTSAFDTTGADDRQRLADAGHPLLVREFTEYLAETFGCSELVDLTSEQDHTLQDPSRALPVCREPGLSESFVSAMDSAPAGLVVCDPGPSTGNPAELRNALARRGLQAPLAGWSPAADLRNCGRQLLAVVTGRSTPPLGPARETLRLLAVRRHQPLGRVAGQPLESGQPAAALDPTTRGVCGPVKPGDKVRVDNCARRNGKDRQ